MGNDKDASKEQKSYMEQRAKKYYESHMRFFENWREGGIEKVWIDADGNICIRYESGKWWHYNERGEWW